MLISLWLMAQLVLFTLSVALTPHLPQPMIQAVLVLAVGALILVPVLPAVARALTRALALAPNAPPRRSHVPEVREFRVPGDAGMPGTALARAPSRVVHASA